MVRQGAEKTSLSPVMCAEYVEPEQWDYTRGVFAAVHLHDTRAETGEAEDLSQAPKGSDFMLPAF